jgi:hypothetical protein
MKCEGCGLLKKDEGSVRFRPEIGWTSCNDCASPRGYAASMGLSLKPNILVILAAIK